VPEKAPSIKESIAELDCYERTRALAVACYRAAIRDVAQYSVELDEEMRSYRSYLAALADGVGDGLPEKLTESRAALHDLLRSVHDKTVKYLADLRQQFATTERALQEVLTAFVSGGDDHDKRLRSALRVLRDITRAPEASGASDALQAVANEIDESLQALQRHHQLTVSQLKAEIGVLHKRIDVFDSSTQTDTAADVRSRDEMEQLIRSETTGGLCLIAMKVHGLSLARQRFNTGVALELLGAFTKRLKNVLPISSVVGKWGDEEFLAAVTVPKPEATKLGKSLTEKLSGMYRCVQEGTVVRPSLQISSAVVEVNRNAPADEALRRISTFLSA